MPNKKKKYGDRGEMTMTLSTLRERHSWKKGGANKKEINSVTDYQKKRREELFGPKAER